MKILFLKYLSESLGSLFFFPRGEMKHDFLLFFRSKAKFWWSKPRIHECQPFLIIRADLFHLSVDSSEKLIDFEWSDWQVVPTMDHCFGGTLKVKAEIDWQMMLMTDISIIYHYIISIVQFNNNIIFSMLNRW